MKSENKNVSVLDARAALGVVAEIELRVAERIRPPLWLNACMSVAVGLLVTSVILASQHSEWRVWILISAIVFGLGYAYYNRFLYQRGFVLKSFPKGWTNTLFFWKYALISALLVMVIRYLTDSNIEWVPYIGGVYFAVWCGIYFYHNPGGVKSQGVKSHVSQ